MEWFEETLHGNWRQRIQMGPVLYRDKTDVQDLIIFESERCGRVLALDNVVQTTESDEFIYHEMIAHMPIIAHGACERVLIIGGGDGGTAREALKHQDVREVVMVEIDRSVVDLCTDYMPSLNGGAFQDVRFRLVIEDGIKFTAETEDRFDVVIVDSTDPIGPGEVLFTESFYGQCKRCLRPGGILVTQSGVPYVQPGEMDMVPSRLRPHFKDVWLFVAPVPTYVGGHMAFGWATDDPGKRRVPEAELAERLRKSGALGAAPEMRHYAPDVHYGAFAVPPWIRKLAGLAPNLSG
jgi:spermidine synthase